MNNIEKDYLVAFTEPGTDEHGTPKGMELIESILALDVEDDGYSYAAFGPVTRENLQDILDVNAALLASAKGISDFAWTAMMPDCDESRQYLQTLLSNLRDAIRKAETP